MFPTEHLERVFGVASLLPGDLLQQLYCYGLVHVVLVWLLLALRVGHETALRLLSHRALPSAFPGFWWGMLPGWNSQQGKDIA